MVTLEKRPAFPCVSTTILEITSYPQKLARSRGEALPCAVEKLMSFVIVLIALPIAVASFAVQGEAPHQIVLAAKRA